MKQVIVMRTDLNMRKGKMIAQGAHATLGVFIQEDINEDVLSRLPKMMNVIHISPPVMQWIVEGMKKIVVRVNSDAELAVIVARARRDGVPAFTVTDAGHTEFKGVPTVTCCAIGPAADDAVDAITGHLELL